MNLIIFFLFSVICFILLTKIKSKKVYWEWLYLIGTLLSFSLPIYTNEAYLDGYNRHLGVLIILSLTNSIIYNSAIRIENKIKQIVKMLIPISLVLLPSLNHDLAVIFSVVTYSFLNDQHKDRADTLISYLIITIMTIKYFVGNYFNSPLSIVNYEILDLFQYSMISVILLCFINSIITTREWYFSRSRSLINIFWPSLFIILSLHAKSGAQYFDNHMFYLITLFGISVIWNWKNNYVISILSSLVAALFIEPYLFLIPLIIILFKHFSIKFESFKKWIDYKYIDIVAVVTIISALLNRVELPGIIAIVIFTFVFRQMTRELEIE